MKILAFESTCDETAVALVEDGRKILTDQIFSQAQLHAVYGGVVPEIASRCHVESISILTQRAIEAAGITRKDIDAVAVSLCSGAYWCGIGWSELRKGLCCGRSAYTRSSYPWAYSRKLIWHTLKLEPPFLCLAISGGNTMLVDVRDYTDMEIIGSTER